MFQGSRRGFFTSKRWTATDLTVIPGSPADKAGIIEAT